MVDSGYDTAMNARRIYLLVFVFAFASLSLGARKRARKGTFIVQSLTKGAEIYVDDRFVTTVPMKKPRRLSPGIYTIRMTKGGYADYLDTFRVRRGKRTRLSIDLLPISGVLSIQTTPAGAMILVDGEPLGRAPLDTDVEPGRRQLRVQAPGYEPYEEVLIVTAGEQQPIDIALIPAAAPLGLDADAWYGNPWLWVGVGAAALLVGGVVAAATAEEEPIPDPPFVLRIETR